MNTGSRWRQGTIGVERALFNTRMVKYIEAEILISAILIGLWWQSWSVGLLVGVVLFAFLFNTLTRLLISVLYSGVYATVGAAIVWHNLLGSDEKIITSIIVSIIIFFIAMAVHATALQWVDDFTGAGDD